MSLRSTHPTHCHRNHNESARGGFNRRRPTCHSRRRIAPAHDKARAEAASAHIPAHSRVPLRSSAPDRSKALDRSNARDRRVRVRHRSAAGRSPLRTRHGLKPVHDMPGPASHKRAADIRNRVRRKAVADRLVPDAHRRLRKARRFRPAPRRRMTGRWPRRSAEYSTTKASVSDDRYMCDASNNAAPPASMINFR